MVEVALDLLLVVAVGAMLWSAVSLVWRRRVHVPRCPSCGRAVSRAYPACPRCGAVLS